MNENFGHISNISLLSVVENLEFKKKWNIKKDQIEICKVCEFRYICTDCRAYTTDGLYSKPLKCNYDPYKGEWIN